MDKHTAKVKMAKKMQSREELKKKGEGIFLSKAWEERKKAIALRVKNKQAKNKKK